MDIYRSNPGVYGNFYGNSLLGDAAIPGVPLPELSGLTGAWLFFENHEGYADGADMDAVRGRVGPNLAGSPVPPTWDDTEKAAYFDPTSTPQYFRAQMSSANGDFNHITETNPRFTIHWIGKHDVAATGFETLVANASLASHTGIRFFKSGISSLRIDNYPDNLFEVTTTHNPSTAYVARSYAVHSDLALDPTFGRYTAYANGVFTGNDASVRFGGSTPSSFDLFIGSLPSLALPMKGHIKALFICDNYVADGTQNTILKDWYEALP